MKKMLLTLGVVAAVSVPVIKKGYIGAHLYGCTKKNCLGNFHCVSHHYDRRFTEYRNAPPTKKLYIEKCWRLDKDAGIAKEYNKVGTWW